LNTKPILRRITMSILKKIADTRRAVRRKMERAHVKGFPIIRSNGWRVMVKSEGTWEEVIYGWSYGQITMKEINLALSEYPADEYPNALIEGSYAYVSHVDSSHPDYEISYEHSEDCYWAVTLRGKDE
tara:strand:+ start:16809 stop:17192 length:384 start_codon:yes stop_codon:yes gene_type:complete